MMQCTTYPARYMWRFKNNAGGGEPGFVRMTDEFSDCNERFATVVQSNPKQPGVYNRSGVCFDEIHHNAWLYSVVLAPSRNIWISVEALTNYMKQLDDIPDGYEEAEWEAGMDRIILDRIILRLLRRRRRQAAGVLVPLSRAEERALSPPFSPDVEPELKKIRIK